MKHAERGWPFILYPSSFILRSASRLATRRASIMLPVSARRCQAMSKAVPWATLVRMIGRPKRDVHRAVHAQQLQGDVPLVVIHRHHRVEPPVAGVDHQRVGRQRALPAAGPRPGRARRPGG